MEQFQAYWDTIVAMVIMYAPKAVLAIVVLLVGLRIIKLMTRAMDRAMDKAQIDLSLRRFLTSLIGVLLKIMLVISVASMVGIATTSFVAIMGAAGLAIGFALQGSLSNFAGGVLILFFKPFKVGDFVETQGYMGTVHSIQILNTVLKTPDNKTVIIPNGAVAGGSMTNFSTEARRRVDMVFGIGYGDDILKTKNTLKALIDKDQRILKDPEPVVVLSELGDSSVNFTVRVWVNSADYWGVYFDMQENVKLTFDKEGISIPFPQRDVHLYQTN